MPGGMLRGSWEGTRWEGEAVLLRMCTCFLCVCVCACVDFLLVAWFGGCSGGGVYFFNSCLQKKKVEFSIKPSFCLFFLQASDGHRVGFH